MCVFWWEWGRGRPSLIAQLVENPLAMQETPVRFLGWEDSVGCPHQYACASLVAQLKSQVKNLVKNLLR